MQLTITIIGAPHGLKGKLRLDICTDQPERRLGTGAILETDSQETGPLTVARTREHKDTVYVVFSGCTDRTMAERLGSVKLTVETDEDDHVEEDAFYEHELVGLEVFDPEGYGFGRIIGLETSPAQDVLVVREPDGDIARAPFVCEIITEADLDDNYVVVRAPQGLPSVDDEADSTDLDEKSGDQRKEVAEEE